MDASLKNPAQDTSVKFSDTMAILQSRRRPQRATALVQGHIPIQARDLHYLSA
jgi:hypothetical protein